MMSASETTGDAPAVESAEPKTVIQFTFENPLSMEMHISIKNVTPPQLHYLRSWVDLHVPALIAQLEEQTAPPAAGRLVVPTGLRMPPGGLRGRG